MTARQGLYSRKENIMGTVVVVVVMKEDVLWQSVVDPGVTSDQKRMTALSGKLIHRLSHLRTFRTFSTFILSAIVHRLFINQLSAA